MQRLRRTGSATVATLALGLLLLTSCEGDGDLQQLPMEGEEIEVLLTSTSTFSPSQVTVPVGATVQWRNLWNEFHTITPDGHAEWPRVLLDDADRVFTHTFLVPGVYPYYCEVHQDLGMAGAITVE